MIKSHTNQHYFARISILVGCVVFGLTACGTTQEATADDEASTASTATTESQNEPVEAAHEASLKLTRDDIKQLYGELSEDLSGSEVFALWREAEKHDAAVDIVMVPLRRTKAVAQSVGALSLDSRLESFLVNDSASGVFAFSEFSDTYKAVQEENPDVDPKVVAALFARTLPAQFAVTGEMTSDQEQLDSDTQAITYTATVEVIDAGTEELVYTGSATLTKTR